MAMRELDSQYWHACAGGVVQMAPVGSKVYYFPQGHAEHTLTFVDFSILRRIPPPMILCRVERLSLLAEPETDEVYARMLLAPITTADPIEDEMPPPLPPAPAAPAPGEGSASFAKMLTQSDANNGGGFSVPRYCAETVLPPLDFAADPPVQTLEARDVHGETWRFRHIFRGTPRRHLLTTGWSAFVNRKRLVAGDTIVFVRTEAGEIRLGIRRAKVGGVTGSTPGSIQSSSALSPHWRGESRGSGRAGTGSAGASSSSSALVPYVGGYGRSDWAGKVKPESVVEAAFLAGSGRPFEVVFYPRDSTPEFVVRASLVISSMAINWCQGIRFKMAFETEDCARTTWFIGTISSIQVLDPIRWPHSPWRMLEVTWDDSDLLQNVRHVSPWMLELVTDMPAHPLPQQPVSPPRKRLCTPQDSQFLTLAHPAGVQGARLHYSESLCLDLQLNSAHQEGPSTALTIGTPSNTGKEIARPILLFGQPILTEQQMNQGSSSSATPKSSAGLGLDSRRCIVFLESDNVPRTLKLAILNSYEELYTMLGRMFNIDGSQLHNRVVYHDATGVVRLTGDEPFSEFVRKARQLTILDNN